MNAGRGYLWIKDLKKQTGRNIPRLLALSHHTDPFYTGSKRSSEKRRSGSPKCGNNSTRTRPGIHLRRVHYHLDAIGYPNLEGKPYTNCHERLGRSRELLADTHGYCVWCLPRPSTITATGIPTI